jgi:hypothetical protein
VFCVLVELIEKRLTFHDLGDNQGLTPKIYNQSSAFEERW